jgi:hypothetical protein
MPSQFVPRPDYPDRVACHGVPGLDDDTAEMRTQPVNNDSPGYNFVVSVRDLIWRKMPTLSDNIPAEVRAMFQPNGQALVACRIIERHPGFVVIEVPAVPEALQICVRPSNIARPF